MDKEMAVKDAFKKFCLRFAYPVSLPEDVIKALGMDQCPLVGFDEFIALLTTPGCHAPNLKRYMPREKAESLFKAAIRKERFNQRSLFSFYFRDAWLEVILQFDQDSLLRRVYIQYPGYTPDEGVEVKICAKAQNVLNA